MQSPAFSVGCSMVALATWTLPLQRLAQSEALGLLAEVGPSRSGAAGAKPYRSGAQKGELFCQ